MYRTKLSNKIHEESNSLLLRNICQWVQKVVKIQVDELLAVVAAKDTAAKREPLQRTFVSSRPGDARSNKSTNLWRTSSRVPLPREFPRTISGKHAKKAVVNEVEATTKKLSNLHVARNPICGDPEGRKSRSLRLKGRESVTELDKKMEFQIGQFQSAVDRGLIWNKTTRDPR